MANARMSIGFYSLGCLRIGSWKWRSLGAWKEKPWGEPLVCCFKIQRGKPHLPKIVRTTHPPSRFAGRLDGRQEQPDEQADNGDNHQQFHKGKSTIRTYCRYTHFVHHGIRFQLDQCQME